LKFPNFAETLERVGITTPEDVNKLKVAKLSFPGISGAVGLSKTISLSEFTNLEKARIPTNIVFGRIGNNNIDLNIKVQIVDSDNSIESIRTIRNKPLYLTVKPEKPAEKITGYIIFKSVSLEEPLRDYASDLLPVSTASLMDAFTIPARNSAESYAEPRGNESGEVLAKKELLVNQFDYEDDDGDGIYNIEIKSPAVEGKYEIRTVIKYAEQDPEKLSMLLVVDPEGYVYEKIAGGKETRIQDAKVSLYWLNPSAGSGQVPKYELWPAKKYQQENPQTTDNTGSYAYLVPEGNYYIIVETQDYFTYTSDVFEVAEGSGVHANIELTVKNFWLRIFSVERIMLGTIAALLLAVLIAIIIMMRKMKIIKIKK
ncbi:MAG: hypothetical protein ABIJ84_00725, partial [bacterium]